MRVELLDFNLRRLSPEVVGGICAKVVFNASSKRDICRTSTRNDDNMDLTAGNTSANHSLAGYTTTLSLTVKYARSTGVT